MPAQRQPGEILALLAIGVIDSDPDGVLRLSRDEQVAALQELHRRFEEQNELEEALGLSLAREADRRRIAGHGWLRRLLHL